MVDRRAWMAGAFIALALAGAACARTVFEPLEVRSANGVHRFQVEIADTYAERDKGLMFRKSLADDRGMLFIFPEPQILSFWMKNTLIPLDIIYIGADGRIVSMKERATPLSERGIGSFHPAQYVLELRGGRAEELQLDVGDRVVHRRLPAPGS